MKILTGNLLEVNLRRSSAKPGISLLQYKKEKTSFTKLDHPPDIKSDGYLRECLALDIPNVPSTSARLKLNTKLSRHTAMQLPNKKKTECSVQKVCQCKNRKISKGGLLPLFEKFFIKRFKCLAYDYIFALVREQQSKTTVTRMSSTTSTTKIRKKSRILPGLGATSFFTLITLICLEMILLSTVSNCAKTFYMHWNTSNSIFRIDNTDHIIDVNKGNLAFEFDQVHIICPVYEPGTFENETEKYIIYNVSKVEYETCRITNADPRVIAICDKPQKLMFFTITFRPFTPQPGGLEFLPGNDYYFISTSSKDDLYRRIGGRCSTNNMKVVFKVCCASEEKNKTTTTSATSLAETGGTGGLDVDVPIIDAHSPAKTNQQQQQHNNINNFGVGSGGLNINSANGLNNGIQLKPLNVGGSTGTSINTNIDQFNRIPMQTSGINVIGHTVGGNNGILLSPGGGLGGINMIPTGGGSLGPYHPAFGQYHPGQTTTGIRINNVPSQYPSQKHNSNNNNNNGKEVDQQEFVGGDGGISGVGGGKDLNIGNQLPPQFLPPIIDTNHSNIVQSTINWPATHWSDDSNIYNNHNTIQNIPNQNISADENHYHSPPHRPPSTTSTTSTTNHNMKNKKDHYDKHPNEVVKNEELTYNSASASIHRTCWSWKKLLIWQYLHMGVSLAASSNSLGYYIKRVDITAMQALSKLENLILNLIMDPLVLLSVLFVTVVRFVRLESILGCNTNTFHLPLNVEVRSKKQKKNRTGNYQHPR